MPDHCPTGDSKQDFLRALALAHLAGRTSSTDTVEGDLRTAGDRIDVSVIIDLQTLINGVHKHSRMSTGTGIELPVETYRRMACIAGIIPIVLNSDGVVVDLGRTTRLANRAQRRALSAMHTTCVMPGCTVASRHCQPHHLLWYGRDHGPTDLNNLVPLCNRHHHMVHEGGVHIVLNPNRSITITYPNGTIQTTGPPTTTWAA